MSKYISEFLGTGFLFCAVIGSGIMGQNLSNEDEALILLINTIVTFFALYFLITSLEPYSSHFNPVVSIAFYLDKKISHNTLGIYILLQILGAVAGVMTANYMFDIENIEFSQKNRSGINFILISRKDKIPLVVASYIGAAYWFTSSTSFANPAGTISRMFSNTFAGISPENVLFFCLAQFIGGILAYLFYKFFFKLK
jgi:glycerol uptake facilitator-like aquaporin